VGVVNGEMVCHTGMIQFPMRKGWKRVHRLVVLPDYQGIGVGMRFVDAVSSHYAEQGWKINLATTTPAMVGALRKSGVWVLGRYGRTKAMWSTLKTKRDKRLYAAASDRRITFSFNYKAA
jgi:GNAT superfamily N-acetyltransferase